MVEEEVVGGGGGAAEEEAGFLKKLDILLTLFLTREVEATPVEEEVEGTATEEEEVTGAEEVAAGAEDVAAEEVEEGVAHCAYFGPFLFVLNQVS